MIQHQPYPPVAGHSWWRRGQVALLAGSLLVTLGAGAMSLATFTDSEASSGAWTAGTIVLGVSPSTTFTANGIMPGDSGSQTVTVSNNGTGALRYAMSSASTNADSLGLAAQITLTIEAGACTSTTSTLFTGTLATAALGSNTTGQDTGDRAVAAGATDNLCFSWAFPLASGNAFQGATTTTTFTFDAEQTANN